MPSSRLLFSAFAALTCATGLFAQTPSLDTLAHFDGVTPGVAEGNGPRGALIFGADGRLYGTTELGGTATGVGFGTIYSVDPKTGVFDSTYAFLGTADGSKPTSRLLLASDGNFYGTTAGGGADGKGTVYKMTPAGVVSILYTFRTLTQKDTGAVPTEALVEGGDGYLYGTTSSNGLNGYGTIFKILPGSANTPIRLVDFAGTGTSSKRGSTPSTLIKAKDGHFYGTTENGGQFGNGTVFRLTTAGVFTTLADFGNSTDTYTGPQSPRAPLVQASNGLFYGTSAGGGTGGSGTVFSVTTSGAYKTLINFTNRTGTYLGSTPEAPLIQGTDGYLYGTTRLGGSSQRGTVFRVSTGGAFKSLIQFTGGSPNYGAEPRGALVQDNEGNLFGTTSTSGNNGLGTVFQLSDVLPPKASVFTNTVTFISGTRATLAGAINPEGTTATYWFEYGTTTSYGKRAPLTNASAGAGKAYVNVSTTITGLTPSTTYHYRLVAMNGGGTTWGNDLDFITGPNPNIVTPPANQLVGIGSPVQLDVNAIGIALKYAWLKTGSATALSSTASYKIAKAAISHAGTYYVRLSDGADSVVTPTATIGVIDTADQKPAFVNEDKSITLTLNNAGPGLTFQWMKPGVPDAVPVVDETSHISGAQTSKLTISNARDSDTNIYFCVATLGSLSLPSGDFPLTTRMRPVVTPPSIGNWTTNGQAYGTISATSNSVPITYTASGLPTGTFIHPTTGNLYGRPAAAGVYNVKFTATNVAGSHTAASYPITVLAASSSSIGTFIGVTDRNTVGNNNLGGGISFAITSIGTGTGKVTHLGKTFSFNVALSQAPGSTRALTITPLAGQAGFPPVVATLTETSAIPAEVGTITGKVNNVDFTAKRNPWDTLANPVPLAQRERFNHAFNVPASLATDIAYAQGSGFGSLTIGTNGVAIWVVTLGDGTDLSTSTTTTLLAADGSVPIHKALYSVGTGSAQGWLSIDGAGVLTELTFDWLKNQQPANVVSRSYRNGFPALLALEADGGKYVKPATNVHVLGLSGTTGNAQLDFTMGGLPAPINQVINFPATNLPTITLANPNTVKIALDLTNGFFSGSFVVPDALPANVRTVTYKGVLIPRLNQGFGQFHLPQLPNPKTSQTLSGMVQLKAFP